MQSDINENRILTGPGNIVFPAIVVQLACGVTENQYATLRVLHENFEPSISSEATIGDDGIPVFTIRIKQDPDITREEIVARWSLIDGQWVSHG